MKHITISILAIIITTSPLFAQEKIPKPVVSVNSGFYDVQFSVVITSAVAGSNIIYTLDGSDPRNSASSFNSASPASVNINPDSNNKRGVTPGVVLRAVTQHPEYETSDVVSRTYIFTGKVKSQSYPGWTWPQGYVNDQELDYEVDPDVVNDSRYKDKIEEALLDIPTISLITDPENLFDPQTGIYVNAWEHGRDWERPAFVELINPDGSAGFQIDCGLRIRGGWSRHGYFPKHAFRLFFRSEYGEEKLRFPLFEDEGTDQFDKIDLRATMNYAWSSDNWEDAGKHNTMNRDIFSRDIQREMKNPYTRSRYYHLYLNGCYWGLFQTQERSEAWFAETYLGGKREDYDVIKIAIEFNYLLEATDGNTDAWENVWNLCESGFQNIENYYELQGLNSEGVRDKNLDILVDIDNLIDYMIIIFYTGNFDAPTTKWRNNKSPNNFYCIYNRKGCDGFKFLAHDNEHTLLTEAFAVGIGIEENRVNIGTITDMSLKMEVYDFDGFHPQWLHFKLSENEEYRIRFTDRVYKHLFNDGPLTQSNAQKTFMETANVIENAIIAESARWGDTDRHPARTKDDDWLPAVNQVINEFFVYRDDIVLDQLIDEDLYSNYQPPVYKNGSDELNNISLEISSGFQVKILNENNGNTGDIIYTTDGKDPRNTGGTVYENAINGGDEVDLNITESYIVKSRIKYNSEWSAINEINLFVDVTTNLDNLKITEIHYHPLSEVNEDSKDFEFIEFKNTGNNPINLYNVRIIGGIEYTFPYYTLNPEKFVVLASNRINFVCRYGFHAFDVFNRNLSNGGDNIFVISADSVIACEVDYSDNYPWPVEADGQGNSMVSKDLNPTGNPNDYNYWRASLYVHGSPGADDVISGIDEFIADSGQPDIYLNLYPNPASTEVFIAYKHAYSQIIRVEISDINGRLVTSFSDKIIPDQMHYKHINVDDLNLSSGVYLVRLISGNDISVKKLIIQKK